MSLIKKALGSQAFKQGTYMMAGNTVASGIAAIAMIIYSRLLGPEKFGAFSIGASTVLLLSKLADGGINLAIERNVARTPQTELKDISYFVNVGLRYKIIVTSILTILFYIFSETIASSWLKTQHIEIVKFAILFASVNVLYDYIALIHESLRAFNHSVWMNISQATTKAVIAMCILLFKVVNPFIVFFLYTLSPLVGILYGIAKLPKWIEVTRAKIPEKYIKALNTVMVFTSISVVSSALSDNIDVLLVKSFLSEYETGLYSAGARLSIIVSILGFSLGAVLNARVAQYTTREHFKKYFKKAFVTSGLLVIGSIVIVPLSWPLLYLTAGREYLSAVPAVSYLLSAAMITAATSPFVAMFYSLSKPQYFAIRGIFQGILLIAANLLLIPRFGIVGAGMARLITRLVVLAFTVVYALIAIKHEYSLELSTELKALSKKLKHQ